MNFSISCICLMPPCPPASLIQCSICLKYSHESCYYQSPHCQIAAEFLCIICRLCLINPFIQITDTIIPAYILPSSNFEQYHKFSLTFPQKTAMQHSYKSLYFLTMSLQTPSISFDWPKESTFFWINSHKLDTKPGLYCEIPYKYIRNSNEFSMSNFEGFSQRTCFMLFLAKKQTSDSLQSLILSRNLLFSSSKYKAIFFTNYAKNKQKPISLRDPLTGARLIEPCKGRDCQHCECFDLKSFLQINETFLLEGKTLWKCPWCSEKVFWNELDVDMYFKQLLKANPEEKFIKFDGFGDWEGCSEEQAGVFSQVSVKIDSYQAWTPLFKREKLRKTLKSEKSLEVYSKLLEIFSESRGFYSFSLLKARVSLAELSGEELCSIAKALGLLKCFVFAEENPLKYKNERDFLFAMTILVDLVLLWAKSQRQIFEIGCLIMCENKRKMPDIRVCVVLFVKLVAKAREYGIFEQFGWTKQKKLAEIIGVLLGFFVEEW